MNFLIVNDGVIVPQYGDENDDAGRASRCRPCSPTARSWACHTREVAYGGGNIHCITQQEPARR